MLRMTQRNWSRTTLSDRKSTRLNSSHLVISYAVFCLKKKKKPRISIGPRATQRRTPGTEHRDSNAHRLTAYPDRSRRIIQRSITTSCTTGALRRCCAASKSAYASNPTQYSIWTHSLCTSCLARYRLSPCHVFCFISYCSFVSFIINRSSPYYFSFFFF